MLTMMEYLQNQMFPVVSHM